MRRTLVLALSALLLVALAVPAAAHVTANPNAGPSGGYWKTDFRVPHGCDGSATTAVRVSIPEGVVNVKPQVVAGWEIETVIGEIEPYDNHGQTITEGVTEVIWRGGPLDDAHMQEFGLSVKLPEGEEGDVLWFPTIQECEDGETAWINVPDDLAAWGDTDDPAPYVTLTAGYGHGSDDDAAAEDETAEAPASDETELTSATAEEGSGGSSTLGLLGLVAGLAGLALGGAAFATARKRV
jgi:periplasmic copper chaperone A